jgi:glucosamine-6-phosphate deaminase
MTGSVIVEKMQVTIYDSNDALGTAAADDLTQVLETTIAERGEAAMIIATGNSQLSFIKALRTKPGVAWDKITVFHMDEYLGISNEYSFSLQRWALDQLVNIVHPRMFYGIRGDAPHIETEMTRYAAALDAHKPVACVLGIGENGHLAFNDPPVDFNTNKTIQIVPLAEKSRRQQVDEGHFKSLDQVPQQALSLTVPALLKPSHVLAVVPEARKAPAVKAALEGPITPDCPASILRQFSNVKLYLDLDSASLLRQFA